MSRGRNNVTICWGAEDGHQCPLTFYNIAPKVPVSKVKGIEIKEEVRLRCSVGIKRQ